MALLNAILGFINRFLDWREREALKDAGRNEAAEVVNERIEKALTIERGKLDDRLLQHPSDRE